MDSNHDKELQRLLCYHYTTGQGAIKLAFPVGASKEKLSRQGGPTPATAYQLKQCEASPLRQTNQPEAKTKSSLPDPYR